MTPFLIQSLYRLWTSTLHLKYNILINNIPKILYGRCKLEVSLQCINCCLNVLSRIPVLRFSRLEFNVQLRLSGMSSIECSELSNFTTNTAVAIFRGNMFAETLDNSQHSTRLILKSRSCRYSVRTLRFEHFESIALVFTFCDYELTGLRTAVAHCSTDHSLPPKWQKRLSRCYFMLLVFIL
jgi:hypothetical protein